MRADGSSTMQANSNTKRTILVVATLVAIMALGLFLRAYWNVDAAVPAEGEYLFSGGSDAYYEKRAIDYILANNFESLHRDPMLNYPHGNVNPNPPFYDYSTAFTAYALSDVFFGGDVDAAAWWVTLWAPVFWGVLTTIPVYLLGRDAFNRKTGLIAAFIWAFSTSAIENTSFGDARHYAPFMFFITLAMYFYVRAIRDLRGDVNYVRKWSDMGSVLDGLGRFFRERREGLGFAALAGVAAGAVALIWKGFPYVIAIFAIYAVVQMFVDHWRNRDPLGLFVGAALATGVGLLMAAPFYYSAAGLVGFIRPAIYIFTGLLFAGAVLAPTRDLPTILVVPLFAIAGLVGAIVSFFLFPTIANSLLYSAVYFKGTALYQTIAEAHPASLDNMVFSVGPWAFFAALAGLVMLLFRMRREDVRVSLFLFIWGLVAIYMASAAVRFLINAVPLLAVLGAWATSRFIDWLGYAQIPREMRGANGFWQGVRRSVNGWHVAGAVSIALLLVAPTVFLAVDAALPPEHEFELITTYEKEERIGMAEFVGKRFGAYGQNYLPRYWYDGLTWLDQYDADISNPADRPGSISWWDYGHWTIAVGRHPAVADNFQNGYTYAARFLLAQNETHATQLLAARQIGLVGEAQFKQMLTAAGAADANAAYDALKRFEYTSELDLEESVQLVLAVEKATGKKIRYFITDTRMMPLDIPPERRADGSYAYGSIERASIFYAPVTLAERDTDDYLEVRWAIPPSNSKYPGRGDISQVEYEKALKDPFAPPLQATAQFYEYKKPFFDSMYYRGYVGASPLDNPLAGLSGGMGFTSRGDQVIGALRAPQPGANLAHWRLVYMNGEGELNDGLRILEWSPGAIVEGQVTQNGQPMAGVKVTAYDDASRITYPKIKPTLDRLGITDQDASDFDIPHASTTTDENGRYRLVAPFSMGGNVTILAGEKGAALATGQVAISREDAQSGDKTFTVDLQVIPANVNGTVYIDANRNGTYEPGEEFTGQGATIRVGNHTGAIGSDGKYAITGVTPGRHMVTIEGTDYDVAPASASVDLNSGETTTHDVQVQLAPVTLEGNAFVDKNGDGQRDEGEAAPAVTRISFTPDASVQGNTAQEAPAFVRGDGTYVVELQPGTYRISGTAIVDEVAYEASGTVVLQQGATHQARDIVFVAASAANQNGGGDGTATAPDNEETTPTGNETG